MTEIERIKAACERLPSTNYKHLWAEACMMSGLPWGNADEDYAFRQHGREGEMSVMLGVQIALAEYEEWGRPSVNAARTRGVWFAGSIPTGTIGEYDTFPAALAALCETLAERNAEQPEDDLGYIDVRKEISDLRRQTELTEQHCSQAYNIARHCEEAINGLRQDIGRLRDRVCSCETWRTDQLAGSREHLKRIEKLEQWWRNDHRMSLAEPLRGFTVATKQDIEATEEQEQ